MNTLNKAMLVGRLGKDPEYYKSDKGSALVIAIATNYTYKDKKGEYITNTDWHTVKFFGKKADLLQSSFSKGDVVYVEGRMTKEEYKDKQGNDRTFGIILGDQINMMQKYKPSNSTPQQEQNVSQPQPQPQTTSMGDDNVDDDDGLPF